MCDGNMASSFKPLEISNDVERRFGLKFPEKRRISTIETSLDIRRGLCIPNFAVVVADESNSWISVRNLKTTVTEITCDKLAKRAQYTLKFIFSSVLTRAVALSGYIRDDSDLFINEMDIGSTDVNITSKQQTRVAILGEAAIPTGLDRGTFKGLLVAVSTCLEAFKRRENVRRALGHWISINTHNVKLIFVLTSTVDVQVHKEADTCNDIIFLDVIDGYDHLSTKTLKLMQWASLRSDDFCALMKIDDDSFVQFDY